MSTSAPIVKRVLGLDLSLTGTGWVLDDALTLQTGLVDTDKLEGLERIQEIYIKVEELVDSYPKDQVPNQTLIVIEDFSFASKGASLFQIAGLGYIIRYYLWDRGLKFVLVPPTVLKKFCTGVGNSDKNVILKEIYKRWGADINDDNIGDAYVLSRIGRALAGWDKPEDLTSFQKDALKQLEKSND